MNFIQKLIQQKKLQKENEFKIECTTSIVELENYLDFLKDKLYLFSFNKKLMLTDYLNAFIWYLSCIDNHYTWFLRELKKYEHSYKYTHYKNVKEDLKHKIEYMTQKKKQYRAEFEKVYNVFKRISKGCNVARRNEILGKMRKAFDFDSSKYYKQEQFIVLL